MARADKNEVKAQIGVSLRTKRWNHSFQWIGRDKKGVSRWMGNLGALKLGRRILSLTGFGALICGAFLLVVAPKPAAFILGGVSLIHLGLAWWMKRLHENLSRLATTEELAQNTGIDPEVLDRMIEEEQVRPRSMINDEYVYDPDDFQAGARLLRPSEPPGDDMLLRPAASAQVRDETLLHTVEEPGTTAPVYVQPEEQNTLWQSN